MTAVAAASAGQAPASAPVAQSPSTSAAAAQTTATAKRSQASAAAAAPAASPAEQSSSLPLSLLLAGAAGFTSLGLGLATLLLLRSRSRTKSRKSGSGGKGAAGPGPCAKLKPTSKCVPLADGSGCVIRREIAADNSCLFNSVGYSMHKSRTRAPHLRTVVAQQVSSDRTTYSEAFLGMTNAAYCNWIMQPYNWGGGIELSILAQAYGMEIAAWNIESCKQHVFGEESGYKRQAMVIYNGVHYDALAVCAGPRANPDDDETTFNPRTKRGKMIIAAARKLVELAHKESQFHGAAAKKQQQTATTTTTTTTGGAAAASAAAPSTNGTATTAASDSATADGPSTSASSGPRKATGGLPTTRRVARSATAAAAAAAAAAAGDNAAAGSSGTTQPAPGATVAGTAKLRCGDCGEVCVGAAAAQQHAAATGHQDYQEVA
ncbi:hypothetical protein PLESTF_000895500 [Pleodorina starrii]|nr:hypothetical protein PLESTM_002050800 [Pleodorina starrii]GLC69915.1 hypothetical protein PLESTF_000895500 [Pleodorina starrii]